MCNCNRSNLQSWTNAVKVLSEKKLFCWTREFFNLQFSPFCPLVSTFQCCNHVTVFMEHILTLKKGRRGFEKKKDASRKRFLLKCGHCIYEGICYKQSNIIVVNSCLFISGVFFYFWSEIFTINNRKMHTLDLLIVKGDTLRLLIVQCVSYDY